MAASYLERSGNSQDQEFDPQCIGVFSGIPKGNYSVPDDREGWVLLSAGVHDLHISHSHSSSYIPDDIGEFVDLDNIAQVCFETL